MPVFRSFFRVIAIPLALVLPQAGWGEEVRNCVLPDELQIQLSEVLGEAGDASQSCPDSGANEQNIKALGRATEALLAVRRNRFLETTLDATLDLGNIMLAELAHPRLRSRAELPEVASEAFQAAWALEEDHHNTEAAVAFKSLLADSPDDGDLQAAFLRNCYLAGDNCPPLWPEQRARIPEWSCTEAVNLAVEHFEDGLRVAALRSAEERGLPEEEVSAEVWAFSFEVSDWVLPASIHASGMIAFLSGQLEELPALSVVLNDPIMHCNQDRDVAVLIRHGFGAPGQTYDDLMRPVMRDNLLDVAW